MKPWEIKDRTHYTKKFLLNKIEKLEDSVKRVRDLHNNNVDSNYCSHCSNCFIDERKGLTFHSTPVKYPCPTIKALDGNQ